MHETAKTEPGSIREKRRVVDRIREAVERQTDFLILGHKDPDEDCIASMVAFALLVSKFNGRATLLVGKSMGDHYRYLLNICTYNSIRVVSSPDQVQRPVGVIVALDTPKPDMLEFHGALAKELSDPFQLKIEIDHHLGGDSEYIGTPGYQLVAGASSTCELIGYLLIKMEADVELLERNQLPGLFTRNIVLAILTGIIGDSKMGKYLKSRKEQWYYSWFSERFEKMLERSTMSDKGNFSSIEQLFSAMEHVSGREARCYQAIMKSHVHTGRVAFVALDEPASKDLFAEYPPDMIVSVSKSVADALAEKSGAVGIVSYYDDPAISPFAQFRMRRAGSFDGIDLRSALDALAIENGGGHPGAVGFRIEREKTPDIAAETAVVAEKVNAMMGIGPKLPEGGA